MSILQDKDILKTINLKGRRWGVVKVYKYKGHPGNKCALRGVLGFVFCKTVAERGNPCEFRETGSFIPKLVFDGSSVGTETTLSLRDRSASKGGLSGDPQFDLIPVMEKLEMKAAHVVDSHI